jgi:hypothetical protein
MSSKQAWTTLVVAAIVAAVSPSAATQRQASGALSSADREAVELLSARYALFAGGWRFKSTGVSVQPSAEGATGIAYLAKDGGRYEDSYVRTPTGWRFQSRVYWRFQSRVYMPPPAAGNETLQLR